jgi:hypothetical protein
MAEWFESKSHCTTSFIKRLQVVSGNRKIKTPDVILKLREFACPNDGDDWYRPSPQPCKCYLCHTAARLVCHSFDGCDNARGRYRK